MEEDTNGHHLQQRETIILICLNIIEITNSLFRLTLQYFSLPVGLFVKSGVFIAGVFSSSSISTHELHTCPLKEESL